MIFIKIMCFIIEDFPSIYFMGTVLVNNIIPHTQCAAPERIHTHPMEGHQKFLGEGGLKR